MTKITPQNLVRHELIGLEARIKSGNNKQLVGIKGKIMDETKNTIILLKDGKPKRIPKNVVVLEVKLPDGSIVEIDGKVLVSRPEDRLKSRSRKW
ncbi:MAG: ribonuclease P protein component 1 [Candidatus Bathyarchaeia archaeon]